MAKNGNRNASEVQQPINLCRCCLAEGCYKDISTEYFTNGQKEVYAVMLLETFNLSISYQEGGGPSSESRLICDDCITTLRDSYKFKKMVLYSEETFKERLERLRKPSEMQIEIKVEEEMDGSSDDFNAASDNDDVIIVDDSLSSIKIEGCKTEPFNFTSEDESALIIEEEPAKKKRSTRKRNRIFRTEEGQVVTKNSTSARGLIQDFQEPPMGPSCSETPTKGDSEDVDEEPFKRIALKETHAQDNTLKILKYSNATIFLWGQSMYRCFYCKRSFRDLFNLRKHWATHPWKFVERKTNRHTGLKKADISFLECKLCSAGCKDLNELMDHLHSHKIHFDNSGHLLIPFRLGSGQFVCEFCQEDCQLFEKLACHMHRHYNTFECHLCGTPLSSEKSLSDHKKRCHRLHDF